MTGVPVIADGLQWECYLSDFIDILAIPPLKLPYSFDLLSCLQMYVTRSFKVKA